MIRRRLALVALALLFLFIVVKLVTVSFERRTQREAVMPSATQRETEMQPASETDMCQPGQREDKTTKPSQSAGADAKSELIDGCKPAKMIRYLLHFVCNYESTQSTISSQFTYVIYDSGGQVFAKKTVCSGRFIPVSLPEGSYMVSMIVKEPDGPYETNQTPILVNDCYRENTLHLVREPDTRPILDSASL